MQKINEFAKPSYYSNKHCNGKWFRVPNELIDSYGKLLGTSGIAIYCVLARHANNLTREAFPTHGLIARKLGLSRKTVIRKIKKLQEIGLIEDICRSSKYCVYTLK